jgi:uncharacterized protein
MRVVSNTSPISNLSIIGQLGLLQGQFETLWIPSAVADELHNIPESLAHEVIEDAKRTWLRTQAITDSVTSRSLKRELHRGEAEAIALAMEIKADLILIDERDARIVAKRAGLTVTGALGILLRAKEAGQIEAVRPYIHALRNDARFFVSPNLEASVLQSAGEL